MPTKAKAPVATTPDFPWRHHLIRAVVVFGVALAVRLLFLLSSTDRGWPHSINYEGDAVIWARAADMFAHGQVPDEGVPHRFYAIAYLIHWLHPEGLLSSYVSLKVGWCTLSALACAIAYLTYARNFPPRTAAIATGLGVFSFGSYVLATSLNVEGLYAPVLISILGGTLELARRPQWRWAVALAALNALALLTREEHLVLLLLSSGYLVLRWTRTAPAGGAIPLKQRLGMPAAIVAGAIMFCLPYSIHATAATRHYNEVPKRLPDYERAGAAGVVWSDGARAFVDSLPAFVRAKTVDFVSQQVAQQGGGQVSAEVARERLRRVFDPLPEPLSTPVFIASHGPMSFALANHPDSRGGFSRAALVTGGRKDPRLNLTLSEHLRIFNHGYQVGFGYIVADPSTWVINVGRKLWHAYQGASLGFTAYNLPYGRYGERRSCDVLTPVVSTGLLWQLFWAALLTLGMIIMRKCDGGGSWLLVVAYKVVIVVGYYGYARQAASILPVIFPFAALGIDRLIESCQARIGRQRRWSPRTIAICGSLGVAAAVLVDLSAATRSRGYEVVGATMPLPQWGSDSFSANAPIEIRSAH